MASERIRTLLVEQFLTIHRAVTLFAPNWPPIISYQYPPVGACRQTLDCEPLTNSNSRPIITPTDKST